MYVAQMKPKLLISIVVGENLCRIFILSDMWYVRQMELFNFMNCWASWTPDELHGSLHPPTKIDPTVALSTPSVTLKI